MESKLVNYIMDRKVMDATVFDLNKILEIYGMGSYSKMCTERIVDEIGIDFKDIQFDPSDLHILLTYWGIERCSDVLLSYFNDEQLKELTEVAEVQQKYVLSQNNLLWILRSKSKKQLKEMQTEASLRGMDEAKFIEAELRSRRLGNKLRVVMKYHFMDVLFRIKYQGLWRIIKRTMCSFDAKVKMGGISSVDPSDKPAIIRRNFEKYQKISLRDRSTDDLKRLVYYGILTYENKSAYSIKGRMSCADIEKHYRDMNDIIQAAARLTPRDFINIFPINKEYDGKRYGTKDYF